MVSEAQKPEFDLNGDGKLDSDEVVSMMLANVGADDDDGDEPAPSSAPVPAPAAPPQAAPPAAAPLVVDHEAGLLRGSVRKGRVRISLIRAANLRAGDSDGLSDPYMKLKLGGMTEVSAVVKKTLNPRFDWDYTFGFEDRTFALAATLNIEAWDHDFGLSLDDKLGHGMLQLAEFAALLIEGVRVERTVALQYKPLIGKAVAAGEVFVAVSWEPGSLLTATADVLPRHKKTKTRKPPRLDEKGTAGIVTYALPAVLSKHTHTRARTHTSRLVISDLLLRALIDLPTIETLIDSD